MPFIPLIPLLSFVSLQRLSGLAVMALALTLTGCGGGGGSGGGTPAPTAAIEVTPALLASADTMALGQRIFTDQSLSEPRGAGVLAQASAENADKWQTEDPVEKKFWVDCSANFEANGQHDVFESIREAILCLRLAST